MPPMPVTAFSPGVPDLRVFDVDANHGKAHAKNMLFIVWQKETTAAAYARAAEVILSLALRFPKGIGVLQTVESGAVPPDQAARTKFVKVIEACETRVAHYSVVHEGAGFKAASVRAIMVGVYAYARPTFPHKIFGSLREAARWHVQRQSETGQIYLDESAIIKAVDTLRTHVSKGAPPDEPRLLMRR